MLDAAIVSVQVIAAVLSAFTLCEISPVSASATNLPSPNATLAQSNALLLGVPVTSIQVLVLAWVHKPEV